MPGELRKDPTTGKWVLVRPQSHERADGTVCPFCPGNEGLTPPEIVAYRATSGQGDGRSWQVRVFPERDPYFTIEEELVREGVGMYDRISTRGASEIVVESPDHGMTLAAADHAQVQRVLWMYRDRIQDLNRDTQIRNVMVSRWHGKPGARIRHPYSRVLAAPIIFDDIRTELAQAREYFDYKRRCVYCDTIREELATEDRLVLQTTHFAAFVPYAARVPFELRILPRRHACSFEHVAGPEVDDLARSLRILVGLLARELGDPPWEMILHTAPNLRVKIGPGEWGTIERDYHWHLEILPNLERRAAVGGIAVTDMLPEDAARILRTAALADQPTTVT
jgi:UDPglucose--hexose-1-phosphate uridylyltransferase